MFLLLLAAQSAADSEILVTASRSPVAGDEIGVSATVIDTRRIEALGAVQAVDLLRLVPGVAVAVSGSRGSLAQVRIRGGEANHSLLFVDGIQYNDPAAGNEPRFETLPADGLGRIEVVRGPQSALWGSEALGGVIALESADPLTAPRLAATGEYGSIDSVRASATAALGGEQAGVALTATHLASDGIDIVGGGAGDRDGYDNDSIVVKAVARPGGDSEIGLIGRYVDAYNEFDGFDPLSFRRADTADNSRTETAAIRGYARFGRDRSGRWGGSIEGQYLDSSNRNRDGVTPLNRTSGDRLRVAAQVERRLALGPSQTTLIVAADHENEGFEARDQQFFGATDQDRTRKRTAVVGEWRTAWSGRFSTDIAVRHDSFNRFRDETTLRAAALLALSEAVSVSASYGEGIAQPTFFDLYGFFPGSFVGNSALKPERSRGYELGLQYKSERFSAAAAAFDNRLRGEIVGTFDPVTFLSSTANASGKSRRRGIELAAAFAPTAALRISANYTYLDADDQQVAGAAQVREVRRPRHSANAAFDWEHGPLTLGGALAYAGKRTDVDFDLFPAPTVTLDDYLLASLRVGYRVSESVELFGRIEYAGDAEYQDVVGYDTPGRAVYAGLRLRLGR